MVTYTPYIRLYRKGKATRSFRQGKYKNKATATRVTKTFVRRFNADPAMKKQGVRIELVGVKKLVARKKTKYTFPWG